MYTSKFKLALHWLLITIGFYLFWAFSYLILAKFALSQVNRFSYETASFWSQLTASDVFWYALFIFGMAIAIFVIRKFIQYAPNRKIAAIVYIVLIAVSTGILVDKLAESSKTYTLIPHIIINLVFIVAIAITYFQKEEIAEPAEEE